MNINPDGSYSSGPAKRPRPKLQLPGRAAVTVLIAVLLAAAFACAALGVRVYRYRTTPAAGLMPTSRVYTREA